MSVEQKLNSLKVPFCCETHNQVKTRATNHTYEKVNPLARILQQNSLAQHWARDWRALALTQVHHGSRLSDSCEGGEALSSVHPPTPATGKLIHDLLCDGRVKREVLLRSRDTSRRAVTCAATRCVLVFDWCHHSR